MIKINYHSCKTQHFIFRENVINYGLEANGRYFSSSLHIFRKLNQYIFTELEPQALEDCKRDIKPKYFSKARFFAFFKVKLVNCYVIFIISSHVLDLVQDDLTQSGINTN